MGGVRCLGQSPKKDQTFSDAFPKLNIYKKIKSKGQLDLFDNFSSSFFLGEPLTFSWNYLGFFLTWGEG